MSNAPSLRNVIIKQLHQSFRRLSCDAVPPSTKWYQQATVFIKSEIPMHHSTKSDCPKPCQCNVIFCLHICRHLAVAVLKTGPDILQSVSPDSIVQTVFPLMISGSNGRMILTNQHSFDTGGAKFQTHDSFSSFNVFFDCVCVTHM